MIGDWSIRQAHPSFEGGRYGTDREPPPLPDPLFPRGSVRTQWYPGGTRIVYLRQAAVESLVEVLRRGSPTDITRCLAAFLDALGRADADRPTALINRRNGRGKL